MTSNQNDNLERFRVIYEMMSHLRASGIRSYQNLSSAYLVANSILVTAIVVMLCSDMPSLNIASILFTAIGILLCLQMVSALHICRAENEYWEDKLIEIECSVEGLTVFSKFRPFRKKESERWDRIGLFPRLKGIPFILMALYAILFVIGIKLL